MPITATITENDPIQGTTTTPANVAASTSVGVQAQITRMEIPGVKGADGDITWQGTWSSSTTYTQNNAVQYNYDIYNDIIVQKRNIFIDDFLLDINEEKLFHLINLI